MADDTQDQPKTIAPVSKAVARAITDSQIEVWGDIAEMANLTAREAGGDVSTAFKRVAVAAAKKQAAYIALRDA